MNDKKENKQPLRTCISLILSFILSVLLVLLSLALVFKVTVLSEEFFRSQVIKSGYVENVNSDLQETLRSYGLLSGLDENFFVETVTIDIVKSDVFREVSNLYSEENVNIEVKAFKENINEKVLDEVEKNGMEISEDTMESINYLSDISTGTYINLLSLPFSLQISSIISKLSQFSVAGIVGLVVISLFSTYLILAINNSRRKKTRYLMYSFSAAFLMLLIPSLTVYFSGKLGNISISNKALYHFAVMYLNTVLYYIIAGALINLFVWLMFFLWRKYVLYRSPRYR